MRPHKVQFEAMHRSKQSDFERDLEGKTSMVESDHEGKRSMLENVFEAKSSMLEQPFRAPCGFKARSSSDFERSIASKENEHARALISSFQLPQSRHVARSDAPKSKPEQRFRAPSGYGAGSSSAFERPVATENA